MDKLTNIDPNATLLRVRELVTGYDTDFLTGLTRAELVDMVMCACSSMHAMRKMGGTMAVAIDALTSTPVERGQVDGY